MRRLFIGLLPVLTMSSCINLNVVEQSDDQYYNPVRIVVEQANSDLNVSGAQTEDFVENLSLFVYSEGVLVAERFFTSFSDMSIGLLSGQKYNLYAVANVGRMLPPIREKNLVSMKCEWTGTMMPFPMSWCCHDMDVSQTQEVSISLTRLVAKVVLDVECSVPGLKVNAVSLNQVPQCICPFSQEVNRASVEWLVPCVHADDEQVIALNQGRFLTLYMLENMQGVLLEGNDDPMKKVPGYLSAEADVCTYLDVACEFESDADKEGEVSYRMYLGRDNVADFNVERNTVLTLTLKLTPDGLGIKDSWKVEADYVQHVVDVNLDNESLELIVGCSDVLSADVRPHDACDLDVIWYSSDETVASVDSYGRVTAKSVGDCVVKAISVDKSDVYDECVVRVLPREPIAVELNFEDLILPVGDAFTAKFRVRYNDGSCTPFYNYGWASVDDCSPEGWATSVYSVAEISSYGKITAKSEGLALISMTVTWWVDGEQRSCTGEGVICVAEAYVVSVYAEGPAMFYSGSGGPGLYGVFSDGSVGSISADRWTVSDYAVSYDENSGLIVSEDNSLEEGKTVCVFTAYYGDMTASVNILYGKWLRDVRCEKTPVAGLQKYRYRMVVVYDDFTEKYVPFEYLTTVDGKVWSKLGTASEEGVLLDWNIGSVRLETSARYHDYTGTLKKWTTGNDPA